MIDIAGRSFPPSQLATTISIPNLRLVNTSNRREHWSKRSKRAKEQRALAKHFTHYTTLVPLMTLYRCGCVVTVTRVGPRAMDRDGNISSMKAVIDGIADALGIDDGDPRIDWRYAQKRGPYGVTITIEPAVAVEAREAA